MPPTARTKALARRLVALRLTIIVDSVGLRPVQRSPCPTRTRTRSRTRRWTARLADAGFTIAASDEPNTLRVTGTTLPG
jgi:hypothetical protein